MKQATLFDLPAKCHEREATDKRKMPLDRKMIVEALREISRLSSEPHIRQIADDVLFAHRIPTRE